MGHVARYVEAAHFWPVTKLPLFHFIQQTVEVESEAVKLSDTFFRNSSGKIAVGTHIMYDIGDIFQRFYQAIVQMAGEGNCDA